MPQHRVRTGVSFTTTALLLAAATSCSTPTPDADVPFGVGGSTASSSGGSSATATGGGAGVLGGVGAACNDVLPCRLGLSCTADRCVPAGTTALGSPCLIAGECAGGQCLNGLCGNAGDGASGELCGTDADCAVGLRCDLVGLAGTCQAAGAVDVGGTCSASLECFAGLYCTENSCQSFGGGSGGTTSGVGVDCAPVPNDGATRAYFEVPGAVGAEELDFFRLPYPNDARRAEGGELDLTGFPTPGMTLLGYDPLQRYLDALSAVGRGWGTSPVATFRFSRGVDINSLRGEGRVHWVDVTPDVAEYGKSSAIAWHYTSSRSAYVCENRLRVRPGMGRPLQPGHVYAVYVTAGLVDAAGASVEVAPNLAAVLANASPTDASLAAVHAAYAPFRNYLASEAIDPSSILNATVFTVDAVREPMAALVAAVEAAPLPTASGWVRCAAGVASPCPQASAALDRGCGTGTAAYDEFQALIELPIFQEGTAPYLSTGGDISGSVVRTEAVCLSLSVPKRARPLNGWPLVVYAHGTGGSFRSHLTEGVALTLAEATLPDGTAAPLAVLGIDQVEHGPRRGSSTAAPNDLFFNLQNPAATRGNPLQGAADQLSLARFAEAVDVTVGGIVLRFDPNGLVFFGHSQGATEGSLMLPFSKRYRAAVLSGNGASLRHSLLNKTSPVDLRSVLPLLLKDPELAGSEAEFHPALDVLQQWIDPADPYNYASLVARAPLAGVGPHSLFLPYGLGDSFSPPVTMQAYAIAAGVTQVENSALLTPDDFGLTQVAAPLSSNRGAETVGLRQYAPASGNDGHFVVFDDSTAQADLARFLGQAAYGYVPSVGE